MSLFQKGVVLKYLQSQDKVLLAKKWSEFANHFHNASIQDNIRNSKEEQYQEGFLRDLFVRILGYTLNPDINFNLTTELKNEKDSKKADGAILLPMGLNSLGKVIGVIELKGTNITDLNKIEVQAFGYKNNQKDCVYVITSNFEKIRFYVDNAVEYIEFNLFQLTEKEFELMYLILAFENISKNIPKQLKEESVNQENQITKSLYKDYSLFKNNLFHNLVALNPQFEPLELFKKSQKLLDRFLFLFFAEDRQLLPPNSVRLILNQWKQLKELDEEVPLYDRFKKYFGYLNIGFKGKQHDVFAYNGGLFKPDEILDNIVIDDNLLYNHTIKLASYDFASEVDVNILGHIFENSLNELDEMKAKLEITSTEVTTTLMGLNPLETPLKLEEKKLISKRKKDGVFYTPKYITKYIVENTLGKLCVEKKLELQLNEEDYTADKKRTKASKQLLFEKLTQYRSWLLQITIIDPACGSGAFLNEALNFLIAEHTYIDELQAKLFGDAMILSDVEKSILENNLFGVDLNEESVEIAKLSLWLRTAQPNRKLNDLNNNIKCGNSLIDDVAIAGEKAFNWQSEFPQIFKEKNKKAWHITTAIHDSRTSQRMIDYKVREKRAQGTKPQPQIILLTEEEETIIVKITSEIVIEDKLSVMAFNVCRDHIHLVLICDEDDLSKIIQKIKAKTARAVNIHRGVTSPTRTMEHAPLPNTTMKDSPFPKITMEHAPLSSTELPSFPISTITIKHSSLSNITMEHAPLPSTTMKDSPLPNTTIEHAPLPSKELSSIPIPTIKMEHDSLAIKEEKTRGEKQNSLWTQKYGCKEITDDQQLQNTVEYVKNNRVKHELPILPILQQWSMLHCFYQNYDVAFRGEYTGGFDVVIGNPPYVARNLSNEVKWFLNSNYETAQYQLELYVGFMELGVKICNKDGVISYIVPNSWLKNMMMSNCRKFVLENLSLITIIPNLENVFADASVDTMIFIGEKRKKNSAQNEISICEFDDKNLFVKHTLLQNRFLANESFVFDVEINDRILPIINKMKFNIISVGEIFDVTRGINPYDKNTGQSAETISTRAYHSNFKKDETFVPELKGMHASRYSYSWDQKHYVSYGNWLAAPRQKKYFEGKRIIFREILGKTLVSTLIDEDFIIDRSLYIAKLEEKMDSKFNTSFVLSILNSKLMAFFFRYSNNEFDNLFPKIRVAEFRNLPIKNISKNNQQPFVEKANQMLSHSKELQRLGNKFQRTIQRKFELAILPKKLQDWYLLTYSAFIKELGKKKIKLSLSQEAEWEDYFMQESAKALALKNEIDTTDKAIDKMVYELYGLTAEEINIIENS